MAKTKNDSPADFLPPPAKNSFPFGANEPNTEPAPPETIPPAKEDKPQPRARMDAELQAMAKIDRILSELPGPTNARVVRWLSDRYSSPRTGD